MPFGTGPQVTSALELMNWNRKKLQGALIGGLALSGAAVIENVHLYSVYSEAESKSEPLVQLDLNRVGRALDEMNISEEQREVLWRNISGDQRNLVLLHGALVQSLMSLEKKYKVSALEWFGFVLFFCGVLILERRRDEF